MTDTALPADLEKTTRLEGDEGEFSIVLDRAWEIWGPSGGYLATIALRAAGRCAEISKPASFYCHFLRSPDFDRVDVSVEVVKQGRRSESLVVRMSQHGKEVLVAFVLTAADAPGYHHQEVDSPRVEPPEESRLMERTKDGKPIYNFWGNVTCRRPEGGMVEGGDRSIIREWVRFDPTPCFEDPFVDSARSLFLLDTFGWPALYERYRGADFMAPNLDTSAWFHRSTATSEWLLIDHECPVADDGLLGVSGRVWNTDGQLVAGGSAQLACVPRPRPPSLT